MKLQRALSFHPEERDWMYGFIRKIEWINGDTRSASIGS